MKDKTTSDHGKIEVKTRQVTTQRNKEERWMEEYVSDTYDL